MSKANPKQICGKRNKSQEAKKIRAEGEKGKREEGNVAHESIRFDGKNGSIKSTPLAKEKGRGRGMAHGQPLSQSAGVQTKSVGNICWHPNYINAAPTEAKAKAKALARTTHPGAQMSESQVSMADNSRKPSTEASTATGAKAQKTKTLGKTIFSSRKVCI